MRVVFDYFRGLKARRVAEQFCQQSHPDEPLHGSWICANEPTRFVVRVFVGQREFTGTMLPPWRVCLIVAVDKTTLAAEIITDDALYRPVLR